MLTIDKEFKALIPPLSTEEYQQLEKNILEEGIREKILVWQEPVKCCVMQKLTNCNSVEFPDLFECLACGEEFDRTPVIIDGHNRYDIAQKHDLDFDYEFIEFNRRDEAKQWMITNQLGRRNLAEFVRYELMEEYERIEKDKGNENQGQRTDIFANNVKKQGQRTNILSINDKMLNEKANILSNVAKILDEKHNTQKQVAKKLNWSTGKTAQAKVIKDKAPEIIKEKLRQNDMSINQGYEITKAIEKVPENKKTEFLNKVLNENKSVNKAVQDVVRQEKKEELQKLEPPKGKYRVIYADPPWSYGDKRAPSSGGCEEHYITMSIDEICSLPISELAEENSVLFLWTTSPLIQEAFEVIKAWGFKYKAMFVWDKVKHNMGHYNSVRHELLLLCTKGSCLPDNNKLYDSVQSVERTEKHSEKPEEFRNIINDLYKYGNKIELFSRKKNEGWKVWGNEID